mmetsp:Transcript_16751/g.42818  ORF Transcript_16751/g.42818 Transcript_16751/m.42818 type:complete len:213 (-) Transcript_16751:158-796(-)
MGERPVTRRAVGIAALFLFAGLLLLVLAAERERDTVALLSGFGARAARVWHCVGGALREMVLLDLRECLRSFGGVRRARTKHQTVRTLTDRFVELVHIPRGGGKNILLIHTGSRRKVETSRSGPHTSVLDPLTFDLEKANTVENDTKQLGIGVQGRNVQFRLRDRLLHTQREITDALWIAPLVQLDILRFHLLLPLEHLEQTSHEGALIYRR